MTDDVPKLYLTITSKPIAIAALERLPAVEAPLILSELSEANLVNLIDEAGRRLRNPDAAD